jgi:hypothetical protein
VEYESASFSRRFAGYDVAPRFFSKLDLELEALLAPIFRRDGKGMCDIGLIHRLQ